LFQQKEKTNLLVAGNNWDNGTVEIPYDRNIYRASAGVTATAM
jgi:hypothetical protein